MRESTYYPVDPGKIRKMLMILPAKKIHGKRRVTTLDFWVDSQGERIITVVDQGQSTTLSLSSHGSCKESFSITGSTSHLKNIKRFLEASGMPCRKMWEHAYETWSPFSKEEDECAVCIEWWPGLRPLVKIRYDRDDQISNLSSALKLSSNQVASMQDIYKNEIGMTIGTESTRILTFISHGSKDFDGSENTQFLPKRLSYR